MPGEDRELTVIPKTAIPKRGPPLGSFPAGRPLEQSFEVRRNGHRT